METKGTPKREFDDIGSYIRSRCLGGALVGDVLAAKGSETWTVPPEAKVYEALELMRAKNVGALVVVDGGKVAGIFSERDYARKVVLFDKASRETRVGEIMSSPVQVVSPDDSVAECMSLMTAGRVRHFPVCDGERLAGIVSIGDLVKSFVTSQQRLIKEYEQYIRGESSPR